MPSDTGSEFLFRPSENLLHSETTQPRLLHSLHERKSSVLSLVASDTYIFSGNQNSEIIVWDKDTFTLKETLRGHTGSVLALEQAKEKQWLISASGDSTIRVWSSTKLTALYVLDPYLETQAGDLFSLAWSPALETIYIGCQNTSIQWYSFKSDPTDRMKYPGCVSPPPGDTSGTSTPNSQIKRAAHKFFDSYPQYERRTPDIFAKNGAPPPEASNDHSDMPHISIPASNVIDTAHYGYVYCMTLIESTAMGGPLLISGSGDETIKLWDCTKVQPQEVYQFECSGAGAIYSLVAKQDTIYAGCQEGHVKVIDLETKTLLRTIIVQEGADILSMSRINSDLFMGLENGTVHRYSASFDCIATWQAHNGIVLSSAITTGGDENKIFRLITGGNDDHINVWDIEPPSEPPRTPYLEPPKLPDSADEPQTHHFTADTLVLALSKFVSIPSVSGCSNNRENCRQAAIWLKKCLIQLGARSVLLPTGEGTNPLVFGSFNGIGSNKRPRILFYGHYDVISAPPHGWNTNPFALTGKNGYLYGRGVTDNKGPIMAIACAAATLLHKRSLGVDLMFLIEGEEECGSTGFEDAVKKHKEIFGHVDAILVSNSTWITEDSPCVTYGLRGVIHCAIEISSGNPDLHSGLDGGAVSEPMVDMIKILSTLTDGCGNVKISNFYDQVRPVTPEEEGLYARLSEVTKRPAKTLSARWREPALSIHNIEISGPKNSTVIPGTVKAQVSIRIVPDQDLETIVQSLYSHLDSAFADLKSPNKLERKVEHKADWWLGDLKGSWYQALQKAVQDVWGVEPLPIREGGSIPSVPYLEKEFGCHALHLPMGQSTDQAHLPNERISLKNLHHGKTVVEKFLQNAVQS